MIGPAPLTPRALCTRWALATLATAAGQTEDGEHSLPRPVEAMGLLFPGRVGLAAGFDRHGVLCGLAPRLGLGAVEIGTFFAPARRVRAALGPRAASHRRSVVGVSIGKHPATPWSDAEAAFVQGALAHRRHGDYLTLNPGRLAPLPTLFARIVAAVTQALGPRPHPVVAKLAPAWLEERQAVLVCAALVAAGAAGLLIPTEGFPRRRARQLIGDVRRALGDEVCLISVGGIDSAGEARARIDAGADLIQVHRALAAQGPDLLHRFNRALAR